MRVSLLRLSLKCAGAASSGREMAAAGEEVCPFQQSPLKAVVKWECGFYIS